MSSQIAQFGAAATLNYLSGYAFPYVGPSAPTWSPGLYWVNTSGETAQVEDWNGSAWNVISGTDRYIALLTADPLTSGSGQTPAIYISDLAEVTVSGYSRQAADFGAASEAYPSVCSNASVLTFGTFTQPLVSAVAWAAMVTVETGTSGYLLCTWALAESVMPSTGQSIEFAIGQLVMDQA